jgi:hypothetical protein
MSFASVVFLLAVWVIILVWLLTRERARPDYEAAFDAAFLGGDV